jgi:hypothetical protein
MNGRQSPGLMFFLKFSANDQLFSAIRIF